MHTPAPRFTLGKLSLSRARKRKQGMAPPPPSRSKSRPVSSAASFGDKRSDARAPLGLPSALQKISPYDTPVSYLSCTLDVSPTGARVVSSFSPVPGEQVQHVLRLSNDSDPMVVNAQVVWVLEESHGGAMVGLRYEDNPPSVRRRIESLVDHRFEDVRRLQFLLALNSHNFSQKRELNELSQRLGLYGDREEMREWTRHAANLFRHRKVAGTSARR